MKERFKKAVKPVMLAMLVIAAVLALCACGGKKDSGKSSDGSGGGKTASKGDGKKTEIVVWHLYDAQTSATLQGIVDDFNESQSKYSVTLLQQGDAVQIRQKMATLDQDEYPAIFCGTPSATCYYESLSYVKPIQDFIDKDDDKWSDAIFTNVKAAYSNLSGRMIGAPLGVSCGGYYVNLDMLKSAGIDPASLTSMEKIINAAIKVTQSGVAKSGINFGIKGVDLADIMSLQGIDLIDAGNGASGKVSKSLLNEGATKAAVTKYLSLVAEAVKENAGVVFGSDGLSSFYNGSLAFCVGTNSNMVHIVDNTPDFKWDFIPFPGLDDNAKYKGCALTEGTGLYITNSGDETAMQGAYEFIKFVTKPNNQAVWAKKLGYVPYTDDGMKEQLFVDFANDTCPSLLTLPEKMKAAPAELRLPYTFAWDNILDANNTLLDNVTHHPNNDIGDYIEQAAATLDDAIAVAALRYK